jgi:hypothetical protein
VKVFVCVCEGVGQLKFVKLFMEHEGSTVEVGGSSKKTDLKIS